MPVSAAAPGAALAFERVSKRYRGGPLALDDVSCTLAAGARTALLGPNGAGKSTAIRLLLGAIRPTAGRVTLLGTAVDAPGYLEARRRTGVVPQLVGMYHDLTAGEYLELSRRLYRAAAADMARVVDAFGLGDCGGRILAQLSGGYQRRVVLAAALLSRPEVLLLDEPTTGLDPLAAHDVHTYLREAMAGRTTLLCTHNLVEAEALCDEVVILHGGRVLVHAPLAELRGRVRRQVLLAARQGATALLAALQRRGLPAAPAGDPPDGVLLAAADAPHVVPDLLRALLADGLDVYEVRTVEPTLEALFLDVVKGAE